MNFWIIFPGFPHGFSRHLSLFIYAYVRVKPIRSHYILVYNYPIGSMYGIYTNIGGILMVNVTIYSIHGSYG